MNKNLKVPFRNGLTIPPVRLLCYIAIGLILFLFISYNLYVIPNRPIWIDESFTIFMSENNVKEILYYTANDVHPPFYYLLTKLIGAPFSYNLEALRYLSLALLVPIVFYSIRLLQLLKVQNAAIVASVGICMPIIYEFLTTARMYALSILLTILATYLYIKLINQYTNITAFLYGIVLLFALYTHYFLVLLPIIHLLYYLIVSKRDKSAKVTSKKIIIIYTVVAGLFLPWLLYFMFNFNVSDRLGWIVEERSLKLTFDSIIYAMGGLTEHMLIKIIFAFELALLIILAIRYSIKHLCKRDIVNIGLLLVLPQAVLIIILLASPLFGVDLFYYRYLSIYSLLFYLGTGALIMRLLYSNDSEIKLFTYCFIFILFIVLCVSYYNIVTGSFTSKKKFTADLLINTTKKDTIIIQNTYEQIAEFGYLFQGKRPVLIYTHPDTKVVASTGGGAAMTVNTRIRKTDTLNREAIVSGDKAWVILRSMEYHLDQSLFNKYLEPLSLQHSCGTLEYKEYIALCYEYK